MPRGSSNKSMFGGNGASAVSGYLAQLSEHTSTKTNVKTVEDLQALVTYYNTVAADIQARKKKM